MICLCTTWTWTAVFRVCPEIRTGVQFCFEFFYLLGALGKGINCYPRWDPSALCLFTLIIFVAGLDISFVIALVASTVIPFVLFLPHPHPHRPVYLGLFRWGGSLYRFLVQFFFFSSWSGEIRFSLGLKRAVVVVVLLTGRIHHTPQYWTSHCHLLAQLFNTNDFLLHLLLGKRCKH